MTIKFIIVSCILVLTNTKLGHAHQIKSNFVLPNTIDSDAFSSRIVGGNDAIKGEFPYLVSIQKMQNDGTSRHICGGSIIYKEWILTAAHCVYGIDQNDIIVKAGLYKLSEIDNSYQIQHVNFIFVHEEYIRKNNVPPITCSTYDIALLKLQHPFELNDKVDKIKLPKFRVNHTGQATVSGWGKTFWGNSGPSNILQKVDVPLVEYRVCKKIVDDIVGYSDYFLDETTVCTGPIDKLNVSVCSGDSGGPLVIKTQNNDIEIIGIVACTHARCGSEKIFPSIYTKVSDFVWWILSTIAIN